MLHIGPSVSPTDQESILHQNLQLVVNVVSMFDYVVCWLLTELQRKLGWVVV